jgi:hypothetical protein
MIDIAFDRAEWDDARRLIDEAVALAEGAGADHLGEALHLAAWLGIYEDHIDDALRHADRAIELLSAIDDADLACRITHVAGVSHFEAGHLDVGRARFEEARGIARQAGNLSREAMVLGSIGVEAHLRAGEDSEAIRFAIAAYAEAREIYARLGIVPGELSALNNLVQAELEAGELDAARAHLAEALERSWARGHATAGSFAVLLCAELAIVTGDVDRGLSLLGAQRVDPRTEPNSREIERILELFGIDRDRAEARMVEGEQDSLDDLVPELLRELAGGDRPER